MNWNWKNIISQIETISIYLIVFLIPLHRQLIPISIIVFSVIFLLNNGLKRLYYSFSQPYLRITLLFYLLLIAGMIHTDHIEAGFFDLEVKLSLAVFPLLIGSSKFTSLQLQKIVFWFMIGCLISSLICIGSAILIYIDTKDPSVFYYDQLSLFQHPSYYSLYLNFCIICIYYYLVVFEDSTKRGVEIFLITLIPIFALTVVLLSSKMGLITLIGVVFSGSVFWFFKSRAVFPSVLVFLVLSTIIISSFQYSSQIRNRISEAVNAVSKDEVSYTTTGARILIWKSSLVLIYHSPVWGYGTGDVKNELVQYYEEQGFDHLVEHKLNAHNQYLQTTISLGIIGLILLLLYMYFPIFKFGLKLNLVYIGFIVIVSANFMVESMLETQAGVVFYAFFNSLLYFNRDKFKSFKIKSNP